MRVALQSPNSAMALKETDLLVIPQGLRSRLFPAGQERQKPGRPGPDYLARIKGKEKLNS